jgi:hypothetical protein
MASWAAASAIDTITPLLMPLAATLIDYAIISPMISRH